MSALRSLARTVAVLSASAVFVALADDQQQVGQTPTIQSPKDVVPFYFISQGETARSVFTAVGFKGTPSDLVRHLKRINPTVQVPDLIDEPLPVHRVIIVPNLLNPDAPFGWVLCTNVNAAVQEMMRRKTVAPSVLQALMTLDHSRDSRKDTNGPHVYVASYLSSPSNDRLWTARNLPVTLQEPNPASARMDSVTKTEVDWFWFGADGLRK